MTFQQGPLVLPCGESFRDEQAAWTHYDLCPKCEAEHRKRGFYGVEAQSLRGKKPRKKLGRNP